MAKASLLRRVLEAVERQDGRDGIVQIADHYKVPRRKSNGDTIGEICRALRYDLNGLICAKGPWKRDDWNDLLESEFGIERRKSYEDIVFELEWLQKQEDGGADQGREAHPWPSEERAASTTSAAVTTGDGRDLRGQLVASRWRVVERLGKGGFGEAFRVNDEVHGLGHFVLKRALDTDKEARLRHEIARAISLAHPNICNYKDIVSDPRFGVFLLQQDGGVSLEKLIDDGHDFDLADALDITAQLGAALDHAHAERILHLDVKPGNVLVRGDPGARHVRLTDFGISQVGRLTQRSDGRHTVAAPSAGYLSVPYSAPEQREGEADPTSASDRYCLALVLCSMLEGEVFAHPYKARELDQLSQRQNDALMRGLHRDPAERFPSCAAFVRAMRS